MTVAEEPMTPKLTLVPPTEEVPLQETLILVHVEEFIRRYVKMHNRIYTGDLADFFGIGPVQARNFLVVLAREGSIKEVNEGLWVES